MKADILIAGVGGQGQILASRLIGAAAILEGYTVRTGKPLGCLSGAARWSVMSE